MATVIIGADVCPIGQNIPYFRKGDAGSLFNDLLDDLQRADLAIANLECPFIERPSPIEKTGPTFGVENDCVEGIRQSGIDVLCLANNHILDHGPAGLRNTLGVCARAGIATVGAGVNLPTAREILVRPIGKVRLGILAVTEHEFSIATRDTCGANPLDLIDFVRNVRSRRDAFDYLIVLLHGGDEFHVPSPRIQETCRFMVEMGANAVIVQHPHCLGGCEEYRGGHIVYGQGALIMDEAIYREQKSFHEGFLVKLEIGDDFRSRMELLPYTQSDPGPGAKRMEKGREKGFRVCLAERSREILDPAFVEAQWLEFCEKHKRAYLSGVLGHGRVLTKLNRFGWLARLIYGRRALLGVRNMISCETHREALETIFDRGLLG
jgi:poly-gamma-glutamate synthesis protein (capsule biosynthesis protein)